MCYAKITLVVCHKKKTGFVYDFISMATTDINYKIIICLKIYVYALYHLIGTFEYISFSQYT